jgi:hypothetical protein
MSAGYAIGRRLDSTDKEQVLLHQLLLPDILLVDHKDRNKLNCRRSNLRPATPPQNNANRGKGIGHSSKFKGVTWDRIRNRWMAKIGSNHRHHFLGRFKSEIEATCAYNEAAKELFGEFTSLNDLGASRPSLIRAKIPPPKQRSVKAAS